MAYRQVYGVSLLDDLHNYFPAILYDAERFASIGQVLAYVRGQARTQFDIFSRETRAYTGQGTQPVQPQGRRPRMPAPSPPPAPRARAHVVFQEQDVENMAHEMMQGLLGIPLAGLPAAPTNRIASILTGFGGGLGGLGGLSGLGGLGGLGSLGSLGGLGSLGLPREPEDVVVRPTPEQIASATTIQQVTGGTEMCSICQDGMTNGTNSRVLNACNHRFHVGCIDTWFTRNVVCPVCRHDVRTP